MYDLKIQLLLSCASTFTTKQRPIFDPFIVSSVQFYSFEIKARLMSFLFILFVLFIGPGGQYISYLFFPQRELFPKLGLRYLMKCQHLFV